MNYVFCSSSRLQSKLPKQRPSWLREARDFRVAIPLMDKTLEGYERHLSRLAAHFGKLSRGANDCVLCPTGDIHKGGGIFWTDDRWICPACWGKAVDLFSTARAKAESLYAAQVWRAQCGDDFPF